MNKSHIDNQKLIDYLLGALPETEAEKFDELSFTDEEFAAQLNAVENNLIDAYLHGELDSPVKEKFQSYYLLTPLRREKLAFAETLRNYAVHNFTESLNADSATKSASKNRFLDFFSALTAFRFALSALGVILALTGGIWLIYKYSRESGQEIAARRETPAAENKTPANTLAAQNVNAWQNSANVNEVGNQPKIVPEKSLTNKTAPEKIPFGQPTPPRKSVVAFFALALPLRDAGRIQSFSVSENATAVEMTLPLESADYSLYRVGLVDQSGRRLWTSGKLTAKSGKTNKFLAVRFSAGLLKSQIYSLEVSGIKETGETEIISQYPFRIMLK